MLTASLNKTFLSLTWAAEFECDRESLVEDPRPRRPVTVTTQETIAKIHDIIMANRGVSERYAATELGISQDRIHAVIHNELHMSKVSVCCVQTFLGPDLKRTRLDISKEILVIFEADPNRVVTMDEACVHHFQPETKQQSKQWKHLGSPFQGCRD